MTDPKKPDKFAAIERLIACADDGIVSVSGLISIKVAARAEIAEAREREAIGPCGKHPKWAWVPDGNAYCSLCREIEQAVAGAYEAAAQATCISCEKGIPVSYDSKRKLWTHSGGLPRCDASLIRALGSSAARRGKQAIERAARIAGDQAALKDVVRLLCNCAKDHDADCSPAGAVALRTMAEAIETEPREYDEHGNAK